MTDGPAPERITIAKVIAASAEYFNLTCEQILKRTRRPSISHPRQVAMYVALKLTGRSTVYVGDRFGGYDHTTVIFARNKVRRLYDSDPRMKTHVDCIMARCRTVRSA